MKVYARLDADKNVIEYPVLEQHIKNRNHPIEWYTICEIEARPKKTLYQGYKEVTKVLANGTKIYVSYEVEDLSLEKLLVVNNQELRRNKTTEINPKLLDVICTAIEVAFTNKLNEFAKKKGYSSIETLVSYKDSSITQWAKDALDGITVRDQTWRNAIAYQEQIKTKAIPLPKTVNEIYSILPEELK